MVLEVCHCFLLFVSLMANSFCTSSAPGDSGAWVFDKRTGRVCGHVLAHSSKTGTTYIAPMDVMLEDIARSLNASRVTLPSRVTVPSSDTTTVTTTIPPLLRRAHPRALSSTGDDNRPGRSIGRERRRGKSYGHQRPVPLSDLIAYRSGRSNTAPVDRSLRAGV